MKKLIIADILSVSTNGKLEGHYEAVAQNYIDIFSEVYDVYVAGGPVYKGKFEKYIELPYDTNKNVSTFFNKFHVLKNYNEVMKYEKDSIIVFQCSAVSTLMVGLLLNGFRRKNVFLIQYNLQMISSKIKKIIFSFIRKSINGIICPGREIGEKLGVRYCVVPDYIYLNKTECIDDTTYEVDFGIYGILAKGKGVIEAAKIIADTPYTMRIAGKVGTLPEDKNMIDKLSRLAEKSRNIKLEIGYLSDTDYVDKIKKTRYCILNYDESYAMRSSGVIFDSLFNCRPVLARKRKYAQFVEEKRIGVVYSSLEKVNFEAVLKDDFYRQLQRNILQYLEEQRKYKDSLLAFLEVEKET